MSLVAHFGQMGASSLGELYWCGMEDSGGHLGLRPVMCDSRHASHDLPESLRCLPVFVIGAGPPTSMCGGEGGLSPNDLGKSN